MAIFTGAATALITPFTEDLKVNYNKLEELADFSGVNAVVVPGFIDEHIHGAAGCDAMDGSIEALSDSLIKLSTPEIQVNVIRKAVGAISESDVLLAAASNAIIVGFQVRPSVDARRLAEKEEVDIRLYSIIYDAIEQLKDAMEGMLSPVIKEEILGSAEVRETFRISKVGTVAGCMVKDGKVSRDAQVRVLRDNIVIHQGEVGSLQRFKDAAKEVTAGYECGMTVAGYNDIKEYDVFECFTMQEVKR